MENATSNISIDRFLNDVFADNEGDIGYARNVSNLSDSNTTTQSYQTVTPSESLAVNEQIAIIISVVLLVPVIVLGVIGNATVCWIVSRVKKLQSPANFQLVTLALADLLSCAIVAPMQLYSNIEFLVDRSNIFFDDSSRWTCKIYVFITFFSIFVSCFSLGTLSVTRAMGVSGKFQRSTMKKTIVVSIVLSYFLGSSVAVAKTMAGSERTCFIFIELSSTLLIINTTIAAGFLFALLLVVASYCYIFRLKFSQRKSSKILTNNKENIDKRDMATFRICCVLIAVYVATYIPSVIYVAIYVNNSNPNIPYMRPMFSICYFGSMMNPLVYTLLSKTFRREICCFARKKAKPPLITANRCNIAVVAKNKSGFKMSNIDVGVDVRTDTGGFADGIQNQAFETGSNANPNDINTAPSYLGSTIDVDIHTDTGGFVDGIQNQSFESEIKDSENSPCSLGSRIDVDVRTDTGGFVDGIQNQAFQTNSNAETNDIDTAPSYLGSTIDVDIHTDTDRFADGIQNQAFESEMKDRIDVQTDTGGLVNGIKNQAFESGSNAETNYIDTAPSYLGSTIDVDIHTDTDRFADGIQNQAFQSETKDSDNSPCSLGSRIDVDVQTDTGGLADGIQNQALETDSNAKPNDIDNSSFSSVDAHRQEISSTNVNIANCSYGHLDVGKGENSIADTSQIDNIPISDIDNKAGIADGKSTVRVDKRIENKVFDTEEHKAMSMIPDISHIA